MPRCVVVKTYSLGGNPGSMEWRQYNYVLAGVVGLVAIVTVSLLRSVFASVFFAITVAYVLYPLRTRLVGRGLGHRVAATVSTLFALTVVVLLFSPIVVSVYLRREEFVSFIEQLPETTTVSALGTTYTLDVASYQERAADAVNELLVQMAGQMVNYGLQFFVFVLVVYVLLLRPGTIRAGVLDSVPDQYHDIVFAYHERMRSILYAIYVLQAAVAFGTFLVGLPFYFLFGYDSAFTLAVISGLLQFIPVVGPSVVIGALGVVEIIGGNTVTAILLVVLGLILVGAVPDILIRPRLARLTAGIPASLYFVGFLGGLLSVGALGVIAGPVAVALVAQSVQLLSEEPRTKTSSAKPGRGEPPPESTSRSDDPSPSTG